MRYLLLLLLLFVQQIANAQSSHTHHKLAVGDTLIYQLKGQHAQWLYVLSEQANLALSIQQATAWGAEIDVSKGIASMEKVRIDTLRNTKASVRIWAKSYLNQAQTATITIVETNDYLPSKAAFAPVQFSQDLQFFEDLRRKANSGLFVYRTAAQIDSIYNWAREETKHCTSIFDFYKIIVALTNFEGSCHNYTFLPQAFEHYFPDVAYYLPITIYYLNGKLIQDAPDTAIPLGAEIMSVNGVKSQELITRLAKYYNSDGYTFEYNAVSVFKRGLAEKFLLEMGPANQYTIEYRLNKKKYTVTLPALTKDNFDALLQKRVGAKPSYFQPEKRYALDEITDGLYRMTIRGFDFAFLKGDDNYNAFNDFLQSSIQTLYEKRVKNLVLDIRGNKGGAGMLYELVYSYLTNRPFRDSNFAYSNFNVTPFKEQFMVTSYLLANQVVNADSLDTHLKVLYPNVSQGKYYLHDTKNPLILPQEQVFDGQLYLLIDEDVASAGAHLASLVKSYTNAIVVGNETNGGYYEHNGHLPVEYRLPNTGILTGFSILYVNQDAQILPDQPKGRGIMPHITVKPTIEAFLAKKDVGIELVKEHYHKNLLDNAKSNN